ncbi:MAG: biotin--[acetyl-CoA-carboxylase] ligase [Chitinophagales bacterium]
MIIGQKEIFIEEINSTNQYAKELVSNTKPFEGTAIFTDYQQQGRGQNGNVWQGTRSENLYLSVILYPRFLAIQNHYLLNKAICLSVWESIAAYFPEVQIKWPNDIYAKGEKVAGILIENNLQGSNWQSAIVGIGVNLNQRVFPEGINATSLHNLTKREIDRTAYRKLLYKKLNKNYLAIRAGQKESIDRVYTKNLLGYQEVHAFEADGKKFTAQLLGVDNQGNLCLEQEGQLKYYRHGRLRQVVG